jgi:polysaccharide biosynthesis protein PslA
MHGQSTDQSRAASSMLSRTREARTAIFQLPRKIGFASDVNRQIMRPWDVARLMPSEERNIDAPPSNVVFLREPSAKPAVVEKRSRRRDPADRRSPLRPERLAPSRARINGRILSILFRAADIAIVTTTTIVAVAQASRAGLGQATLGEVAPFVASALVLLCSLFLLNAYALRPREKLGTHLGRLTAALGLTGLAAFGIMVLMGNPATLLTPWLAITFLALYLAHLIDWLIVRSLRKAGKLTINVVLVGGGKNAERMIEAALASGDIAILGIFDDRAARGPRSIRGVSFLGDTQAMIDHRVMPFVDKVVIAVPSAAQDRVRQLIERLSVLPNPLTLFVDVEGDLSRGRIAQLADAPLAYLSGRPNDDLRAIVKRLQDLIIGSLALVFTLPLMSLVALAVRLDSPGPILFRQRRHGFNNEEIVVWKFRTMRSEASDANARRQVEADDARVTRVGRILRRLSLDEIPQIFNVLRGEMSLVGPRPHAIGMMTGNVESARLVAEYAHRHRMKPGITGWAAIKGSRGPVDTPASVRRRVALDIEYVERQSFWLDLYIMAMTIPCLFGDDETVR